MTDFPLSVTHTGDYGMDVNELITSLGLTAHPEGGFYRETYRSPAVIDEGPLSLRGPRHVSTAIYYLLPEGETSSFHRIRSDEMWHFYLGGPLRIVELADGGGIKETLLGAVPERGQTFQHTVPAGTWFGAEPVAGARFALVGCTVAPGFDFADFEMMTAEASLPYGGRFARYRHLLA